MSSGIDRTVRSGVVGKHKDKQNQEFFSSAFPEKNLWFAVIYRALEELEPLDKNVGNIRKNKQSRKEAGMWFFTSPSSRLDWICNNFGIDVAAVREEAERRFYNLPRKDRTIVITDEDYFYDGEQLQAEEVSVL